MSLSARMGEAEKNSEGGFLKKKSSRSNGWRRQSVYERWAKIRGGVSKIVQLGKIVPRGDSLLVEIWKGEGRGHQI
ncbi:hypothetical protein QG37_02860 [Candidozyma auris]|nr:hypothetical protein QG37_02860 [[Candida] auris]